MTTPNPHTHDSPSSAVTARKGSSAMSIDSPSGAAATPSASTGTEDAAEADNSTEKDEADASAPGMDTTATSPFTFPSIATSDVGEDESIPGDLEQKLLELEASGWRPPEETADAGENDDDDDYYNAVDLMSDEEDSRELRHREETQFLSGEDSAVNEEALARRLSLSSENSNDSDFAYYQFNNDNEQQIFDAEIPFSEAIAHLHPDNLVDRMYQDMWKIEGEAKGDDTPVQRRMGDDSFANQRKVRFEDEVEDSADDDDDDDTSDSEEDKELYPDIFVSQEHLDPTFRQLIEDDYDLYNDDDDGNSDAGSCWDFEGEEARIALMEHDGEDESDSDSSAGSSGYESDDGDTTDEEIIEPPPPPKPEQRPASKIVRGSQQVTLKRGLSLSKRWRKGGKLMVPKRGTFNMEANRPVLTVEFKGKKESFQLWPARKPDGAERRFWQHMSTINSINNSRAASRNTSPRMSVTIPQTDDNSISDTPSRSLSIDSVNAFFDNNGCLLTDQVVGPMEAFVPFTNVNATGHVSQDNTFDFASLQGVAPANNAAMLAEEEEEQNQDPMSFINFDESDADDDEDEDMHDGESDIAASPSTTKSAGSNFPHLKSNGSGNSGFDLLAHLDRARGMVGSFRRNQHLAKTVGSLPAHPALRASASETNAMQTGRRAAANLPITPARKKKIGRSMGSANAAVGARGSPIASPLATRTQPSNKKKGPIKGGFSR